MSGETTYYRRVEGEYGSAVVFWKALGRIGVRSIDKNGNLDMAQLTPYQAVELSNALFRLSEQIKSDYQGWQDDWM